MRFTTPMLLAMLLGLYALGAALDAGDIETELDRERRDWMYAQQHCLRMYGAQAAPEYDYYGVLICRTRRGESLPYRVAAK